MNLSLEPIVLLNLLLRVLLVVLAGGIVAVVVARRSPARAHLVATVTLAVVLVLPVLTFLTPSVVTEGSWQAFRPPMATSAAPNEVVASPQGVSASGTPTAGATVSATSGSGAFTKDAVIDLTTNLAQWGGLVWGPLLALWATGILVGAYRLVRSAREARRWWTAGTPVDDGVRLCSHTPLPCSLPGSSARILLPTSAEEWSTERREAVLAHERAHALRRDAEWQLVGRVAAVVYGPIPLVNALAKRQREWAEFAADDLAVHQGAPADTLAQALLDLSSTPRLRTAIAVPFFRPRGVRPRILRLLTADLPRQPISRAGLTLAASAAAVVSFAGMYGIRTVPGLENPPASGSSSLATTLAPRPGTPANGWRAVLPDRRMVTLERIVRLDHKGVRSDWTPDGRRIPSDGEPWDQRWSSGRDGLRGMSILLFRVKSTLEDLNQLVAGTESATDLAGYPLPRSEAMPEGSRTTFAGGGVRRLKSGPTDDVVVLSLMKWEGFPTGYRDAVGFVFTDTPAVVGIRWKPGDALPVEGKVRTRLEKVDRSPTGQVRVLITNRPPLGERHPQMAVYGVDANGRRVEGRQVGPSPFQWEGNLLAWKQQLDIAIPWDELRAVEVEEQPYHVTRFDQILVVPPGFELPSHPLP